MELNEQTLEQILTRQREEYQRHLDEVSLDFQQHVNEVRRDFKTDLDAGLEETRRHMGVLVEGLEHKVQLIAEGHDVLREEMKLGFAAAQTETDALREEMKVGFAAVRTETEAIREDMKVGIAGVRMETEAIRLELEMIRSELSIIRRDLKEKVGRDELAVLEARVAKLEQAARR